MPEEKRVDAQAAPEVTVEAEVIEDNWSERSAGSDSWRDDDERAAEVADDATLSLQDHLVGQLEYANLAPRELAIARAIVDAINDDGYITDSLDDIAATLLPEVTADAAEVERVLRLVQTLDPAGIAARNLSECLALQLRTLHPDTPGLRLALAIADKHLDLLADRELTLLRRELSASDDELGAGRGAGARTASASGRHRQQREGRIRGARCVRAPHRSRLDRRSEQLHAAARAPQPELCRHARPRRRAFLHARAAAGSALAAQEPRDPQRNAHEGGAQHRRTPDAPSSSTAKRACGR